MHNCLHALTIDISILNNYVAQLREKNLQLEQELLKQVNRSGLILDSYIAYNARCDQPQGNGNWHQLEKLGRASILEKSTRVVRKVSADSDNLTNLVRLYLL